jgi:hypothetical protein
MTVDGVLFIAKRTAPYFSSEKDALHHGWGMTKVNARSVSTCLA